MDETNGRFRKKRTNFSMISNEILRDKRISLKAKGLYSLIQSYITIENFVLYKKFLKSRCSEGERAFNSAWKELKSSGYLIQYKIKNSKTQRFYYEYKILDTPNHQNEVLKSTSTFCTSATSIPENVSYGNVCSGNSGSINNILKNNISSNHITSDAIRKQIEFEYFRDEDKEFAESVVLLMTDIFDMDDEETICINQRTISIRAVKERFRKINHSHVEYVILVMNETTSYISNIKQYLLAVLYNAQTSMPAYYVNRMKYDIYYKD